MHPVEIRQQFDTFVYNVTWLRKSNGLSLRQMGRVLGISAERLAQLESGRIPRNLPITVLNRISQIFSVSLSELFSRRLG